MTKTRRLAVVVLAVLGFVMLGSVPRNASAAAQTTPPKVSPGSPIRYLGSNGIVARISRVRSATHPDWEGISETSRLVVGDAEIINYNTISSHGGTFLEVEVRMFQSESFVNNIARGGSFICPASFTQNLSNPMKLDLIPRLINHSPGIGYDFAWTGRFNVPAGFQSGYLQVTPRLRVAGLPDKIYYDLRLNVR